MRCGDSARVYNFLLGCSAAFQGAVFRVQLLDIDAHGIQILGRRVLRVRI